MKKMLLIICIFLGFLFVSYGGSSLDENCGCGVGTMVFEGQDGLLSQTLAITTNGIFLNQFFGITSGTLGCEQAPGLVAIERINIFVAGNMDNLAKDIAMGQGEVLDTLADLMDVPHNDRSQLYKNLKNNFSHIYSTNSITSNQVVQNIFNIVNS